MYVDLPAMLGPVSTISDAPALPERGVVGHECAGAHDVLHHRVPARRDVQHAVLRELRADVAVPRRRLREAAEEVHLRHRRRRLQDARRLVRHLPAHLPENGALQLLQPLLRVQDQRLKLLQLRRDVPLGVHQRLPPDVLLRHPRQVRVGHFQVVAEDPVVADLQRPDARPLALLPLQSGDVLLGVPRRRSQVVQLLREPRPHDAPVAALRRRVVVHGRSDDGNDILARVHVAAKPADGSLALRQQVDHGGHGLEASAQRHHLAGRRVASGHPVDQPLQVAHAAEQCSGVLAPDAARVEPRHGVQPALQLVAIEERLSQPPPQQATAHRRLRVVEHVQQRRPASEAPRAEELQVPPRLVVEHHVPFRRVRAERRDLPDVALLRVLQVGEQRARSPDGQRLALAPVGLERGDAEVLQQRAPRRREAEVGVARQCHGGTAIVARRGFERAEDARGVQLLGDEQLRGAEALQLQRQRQQRHLRRRELRRRDVGVGQSREVPLQRNGRDEVVGPLVQQARLHDRPRRDDAHDVALDQPGACHGVADLLADGHLVAAADEPRQVALQRVRWHAGHGHSLSLAHVAARQHDVELRRRRARVLVEGLVEIAEPEEDDGVGVARLHLEVLPAQG